MGSRGGYKYGDKSVYRTLGIGIPDMLMNLMSCHGFLNKIKYFAILKCPKRMLEYFFSKGFTILECNVNIMVKLRNDVKQTINAEETYNLHKFMTCINTVLST